MESDALISQCAFGVGIASTANGDVRGWAAVSQHWNGLFSHAQRMATYGDRRLGGGVATPNKRPLSTPASLYNLPRFPGNIKLTFHCYYPNPRNKIVQEADSPIRTSPIRQRAHKHVGACVINLSSFLIF